MLSILNDETIHKRWKPFINRSIQIAERLIPGLRKNVSCLRLSYYNLRNLNIIATINPRNKILPSSTV